MPRILLFSVSIGAGHDFTAKAIAEEVKRRYGNAVVEVVDTFKYINPVLNKVVTGSYMEALKYSPKVWGYLYEQAEQEDRLLDTSMITNKLLSNKLKKLIEDFQPSLVICSHAFPCGMLATLKRKHKLDFPLLAAITDYTIHPFWIYPEVDRFIIPSEQLSYSLLHAGVPAEKIWPLGLPIRAQFASLPDQDQARKNLGLTNTTTVLVMGGGLGLGSMEEITAILLQSNLNLQIVVICGKNNKLQAKLEQLHSKHSTGNSLEIVGFTDQMSTYMCAADLMISKPGGLTVAEILACQIPLLIIDPIPGQEIRNADFLLNHGVAMKAANLREVIPIMQQLINNPLRLKQIKEMAAQLGKPRAATDIVDKIEQQYLS